MPSTYDEKQYDEVADGYDRVIRGLPVRELMDYNHHRIIGDVRDKSILDLACGNGLYTQRFKRRGASRVVGVNLSSELI